MSEVLAPVAAVDSPASENTSSVAYCDSETCKNINDSFVKEAHQPLYFIKISI